MSDIKKVVIIKGDATRSDRVRSLLGDGADKWSPVFVDNVDEALQVLKQGGADVSAMVAEPEQWTSKNSILLDELKVKHPSVAPLSFSVVPQRPAQKEKVAQTTAKANPLETVASATDPGHLRVMLDRTHALHKLLTNEDVRELVSAVDQLPSLPTTHLALMQAAARPNSTVQEITDIIQSDPAMSVKVLQLVNSSLFGQSSRVSSVSQAVSILGVGLLKGLTASAHVFSALDASSTKVLSVERSQLYAMRVARIAQAMASTKQRQDEAFTAGLLHNIGEIVLAVKRPDEFFDVIQRCAETNEWRISVERELLGVTHPEVGAQLLTNWGIPFPIVEVAAFHHEPRRVAGGDVEVLAVVHTADALAGILTCGDPEDMLDVQFLERAGLVQNLPRWRQLVEDQVATWTD